MILYYMILYYIILYYIILYYIYFSTSLQFQSLPASDAAGRFLPRSAARPWQREAMGYSPIEQKLGFRV